MINLDVIEQEILDLEKKDTTYAVIERLAWLYIVRDHLRADTKTGQLGDGEFCEACSNVPMTSLMSVLSEHMDVLNAVYPKEYNAILTKIRSL